MCELALSKGLALIRLSYLKEYYLQKQSEILYSVIILFQNYGVALMHLFRMKNSFQESLKAASSPLTPKYHLLRRTHLKGSK